MGAKTWMLAYVSGSASEILNSNPTLDREAINAPATKLYPSDNLEPLDAGELSFTCPRDNELVIGRFRDRRGETLFVDARKLGTMADRVHRELLDADIAKIAGTFHAWRGELLKDDQRWAGRSGAERERARTAQSFGVPKADIAAQGDDLSLNRYKEVVHEAIEHRAPKEILAELAKLEEEIQQQEFGKQGAAVDALKATCIASAGVVDSLFASLQHRAFRGGAVAIARLVVAKQAELGLGKVGFLK